MKLSGEKVPEYADNHCVYLEGLKSMLDLDNKVALVTGASRGLGRGIALVLAEKGANLIINYHREKERAEEVAAEVEKMGRKRSCFLCSKAAMQKMRQQNSGRIVSIASIVGHRGALYGHVHYATTKSGMFGFTKTLARTAAQYGITVNCVAPGIIETELLFQTHGAEEVKKLADSVLLGLGKPRDVGLAVAYLCGEGGRYITGATIDVNGGMYLR
jgi:NAD(P)-dependent dehydrogenase (short-subunit alcohol dehydrogenase family)